MTGRLLGNLRQTVVDEGGGVRARDRDTAPRSRTVGFQVPAELDQLSMVHALAETVLLVGGFALDEVTSGVAAVSDVPQAARVVTAAMPSAVTAVRTGSRT